MDRIKIYNGAKLNLSDAVERLQDYTSDNIVKRMKQFFDTPYGVNEFTVSSHPSYTATTQILLPAGCYLFSGGEVVEIPSDLVISPFVSGLSGVTAYTVYLEYKSTGTSPIPTINGFYYTESGDDLSTRYSNFLDDYSIAWVPTVSFSASATKIPLYTFTTNFGATAFAATDYSHATDSELAALRGKMRNAPIEDRMAYRHEWQKRLSEIGPDDRMPYMR